MQWWRNAVAANDDDSDSDSEGYDDAADDCSFNVHSIRNDHDDNDDERRCNVAYFADDKQSYDVDRCDSAWLQELRVSR